MADQISFSFSPNKSDFYKTLRAFTLRNRSLRIVTVGVLLILIGASITSLAVSHAFTSTSFTVLMVILLILLTVFFLGPATVADKVSSNERFTCETTWVVDEDKVSIRNKFGDTNFDWGTFDAAYETQDHYLITYATNKNMYQILPKRAFGSTDQQEGFRSLLTAKTKSITRIRSVNLPELSKRTCQVLLYGTLVVFIILLVASSYIQASGR
jgi:hypothetical protein